jgi:hypothetical protein
VVDPSRAETGLTDHEPVALLGDEIGHRHPNVVEDGLGMTLVVDVAEHLEIALEGDTRGVHGDQDLGLLAMRRR